MSRKRCFLIGAGAHYENDRITDMINHNSGDIVIAVDGGYDYLKTHNILPDLIIGDFDSGDSFNILRSPNASAGLAAAKAAGIPVKQFPSEKDYTDMFLAVKEGFSAGYDTFLIYGGTGNRFDHTFANIQLLSYIAGHGGRGYLYGDRCVMTVITDSTLTIAGNSQNDFRTSFAALNEAKKTGYISIFSLSDVSEGVTISGLKYTADNITLSRNESIGTSNEFTEESILKGFAISVQHGTLLIVSEL